MIERLFTEMYVCVKAKLTLVRFFFLFLFLHLSLIHSEDKPFSCEQCKYSSTQAVNLRNHMLTHSGEKPFSCRQCNFSCTQAIALKRHMLRHSGENPFSCSQCNYSCKTAGRLKTHMLTLQEKSLLVAHSVTIPSQKLGTSNNTCSNILEKSPLHVISVNTLAVTPIV